MSSEFGYKHGQEVHHKYPYEGQLGMFPFCGEIFPTGSDGYSCCLKSKHAGPHQGRTMNSIVSQWYTDSSSITPVY